MSNNPNYNAYNDILFCRGNIGHHEDPHSIYRPERINTYQNITILIPVLATFFSLGDSHRGSLIEDEYGLREALWEHVNAAGPIWALIQEMSVPSKPVRKIVNNLSEFRFESRLFDLSISYKNPFLRKMDVPIVPGNRLSIIGGYFILIRNLPAALYRIRFGGVGPNKFYTDSLYEIKLYSGQTQPTKDVSDRFISLILE